MIRDQLCLDGLWDFHCATGNSVSLQPKIDHLDIACRTARVPGPWQAQFDDLRMASGTAWYRRHFKAPPAWRGRAVILRFGAVNYHAEVQLNGRTVGSHEGGFLPFEFDVTDAVRLGADNELLVRVILPTSDPGNYPEFPFAEIPFGKQSWYGPLGGIWQSVVLESRSPLHLTAVRLVPRLEDGGITVRVMLAASAVPVAVPLALDLAVTDAAGATVTAATLAADPTAEEIETELAVPAPLPWSPEAPNLYRLTATLRSGRRVLDRLTESFGFRTIQARGGRLYLNGALLYLRGALDQDYYPDGICTAPSLAFLEDQLRKAKELGLNCLRCHIKVPDPRYYEVADRLGMLIWSELPNFGLATPRARERAEATLRGIVERDGNHPSIICWTIINENWGVDLVHDADHRDWLKRMFAWLKAFDPTRLVVDNSPIAPSLHVQTDIEDFHYYAAMPDDRRDWDGFLDGFAGRADWTFSRNGDAERTGQEPLIVSEFGNWGLPDPAALAGPDGREPWWFETGHDWSDGVMYPHGIEQRFRDWHLDRVFGSLRGLVEAAQWQQFLALKYQIEAMRRRPQIAGYVLTEFTDCHWESNGLLDMRRNPRVFHERFAEVNADTVIVPRWERTAYWEGETAVLGLTLAHGAGPALKGARLEARLAHGVELAVPAVAAGEACDLGTVELAVPLAGHTAARQIELTLRSAAGEVIASNRVDLVTYPRRLAPAAGLPLWSPDPALRERLAALGYALAPSLDRAAGVVAERLDGELHGFVRHGGALLLLADHAVSLDPFFPNWQRVRVQGRDGTPWRGDWASSFAWLRREGPFARVPGPVLIDHAFDRVIPRHVILGCNRLDFEARVHAGMVVGWVHKPAALIVERNYGQGRLVATTFRLLADAPEADPTATTLLDGLIELALAGACVGTAGVEVASDRVPTRRVA